MKKILVLIISLFFFIPISVMALNKDYEDVTANIVNEKIEENGSKTFSKKGRLLMSLL